MEVNIGGLLQPLNTLAQLFEVRTLDSDVPQWADIGERVVNALVLGLAGEVEVAPILMEAPERRLGDAGVVGSGRPLVPSSPRPRPSANTGTHTQRCAVSSTQYTGFYSTRKHANRGNYWNSKLTTCLAAMQSKRGWRQLAC